ncbi:UrcA family protein [Altererythrobacter salegens]|uniref:UrcA family protein n=1 Tax=Croceibacterium salegens TaxID=1737568 RepID=A0A6I4SXR7_9SPHN|nr:UrcA family protein [Croceibacterium salegens]MXO59102.1 UrcA family protein [Croceibacterium salegens]
MTKFVFTSATVAALACAPAAIPAQAQDLRVPIEFDTRDVATPEGARQLAKRIDLDVSRACGRLSEVRDLQSADRCRTGLLADAAAQLEAKGLMLAARNIEKRS